MHQILLVSLPNTSTLNLDSTDQCHPGGRLIFLNISQKVSNEPPDTGLHDTKSVTKTEKL